MIDLVYMILSLLSILNIKIKGLNTFFEDYMDLNIIVIFWIIQML